MKQIWMDLRWTDKMRPHYINWKNILEKERNEKRHFWINNNWEFPQINVSDTKSQTQEAQRTPSRINTRKKLHIAHHHQTTENQRLRKKSWSSQRKKHLTYGGLKIRITSDFSTETIQSRREWSEIFKVFREKNPHQTRIR